MCRSVARFAIWLCAGMAFGGAAQAEEAGLRPTPMAWRLNVETLQLPQQSAMQWGGGSVLVEVSEGFRAGVGSYGALGGEHGGFITLGVASEWHTQLGRSWWAHAGGFLGAGGGNAAPTLAGDGLFWRADLGLAYDTGYGRLGGGFSHVRFVSGEINSTQPYLFFEYPFFGLLAPRNATRLAAADTPGEPLLPVQRQSFGISLRQYAIAESVQRVDGQPQHPSMELLGVRWQGDLASGRFAMVDAQGALGGQSSGYMQILAGAGYRWALLSASRVAVHLAGGPAGGGGVQTDGGLLFEAGLSWQQPLSRRNSLELTWSAVRSRQGGFAASSLGLSFNHHFGLPLATSTLPLASRQLAGLTPLDLRLRLAQQRYAGRHPQWRNSYVERDVGNLGLQFDAFVHPNWFLTGQGLAAATGNAGAYMTGQIGVGAHWPAATNWFVEAEALVGAAGGGGLAMGDGLVGQVNASLGWQMWPDWSVLLTRGRMRAVNGRFDAEVTGLALAHRFHAWVR